MPVAAAAAAVGQAFCLVGSTCTAVSRQVQGYYSSVWCLTATAAAVQKQLARLSLLLLPLFPLLRPQLASAACTWFYVLATQPLGRIDCCTCRSNSNSSSSRNENDGRCTHNHQAVAHHKACIEVVSAGFSTTGCSTAQLDSNNHTWLVTFVICLQLHHAPAR